MYLLNEQGGLDEALREIIDPKSNQKVNLKLPNKAVDNIRNKMTTFETAIAVDDNEVPEPTTLLEKD